MRKSDDREESWEAFYHCRYLQELTINHNGKKPPNSPQEQRQTLRFKGFLVVEKLSTQLSTITYLRARSPTCLP